MSIHFFRRDDTLHQYASFQVIPWSQPHRNEIQTRHFINDILGRRVSVLLARLGVGEDDFFHELPDGNLKPAMVLQARERVNSRPKMTAEEVNGRHYSRVNDTLASAK